MSTPHLHAATDSIADTVLLPGDPLRAEHIARQFLSDVVEVNRVRNMLGFTGVYAGQRITVMGSGMGIPSCMIYATELIRHYGVRRILRLGTCGAVASGIALGDLVLAISASTDSAVNRRRFQGMDYAATADFGLTLRLLQRAQAQGLRATVGSVFSTDRFYDDDPSLPSLLARMGVLAVEMEAAGLYAVASEHGAQASALLTVSDHLTAGTHFTSEQRQSGLDAATRVALDVLCGVH
jgi:purine-nucleoside phosphorylase